jgi:hypothetical protein
MMFRKLYWITEEFAGDGTSRATGVYTSVPDLIDKGLRRLSGSAGDGFRVSLCQLDSDRDLLRRWNVPTASSISGDLDDFVKSGELSIEESNALAEALSNFKN